MKRPDPWPRRSDCPISIALELLGDAWSLLVVRDLMFKGCHSFQEFLAAGEGIASNVLAARLKRLTAAGIIRSAADPADARRRIYSLTERGIGLAPVLVELVLWSDANFDTAAPPAVTRRMRRQRAAFLREVRSRLAR